MTDPSDPTDLSEATVEHFQPHKGSRYVVTALPAIGLTQDLPLELVEVSPYPLQPGRRRAPFSLLFRGPAGCYLPQRIYRLQHAVMGSLELFLVPIQPQADGSRFEAVFN